MVIVVLVYQVNTVTVDTSKIVTIPTSMALSVSEKFYFSLADITQKDESG